MTKITIKVGDKVVYEGPSGDLDVKATTSKPHDLFGSSIFNVRNSVVDGDIVGAVSMGGSAGVIIQGTVTGSVRASGDVHAGAVGGNVQAQGDVKCKAVTGNVQAQGDVHAGDVHGNITAMGDVKVKAYTRPL